MNEQHDHDFYFRYCGECDGLIDIVCVQCGYWADPDRYTDAGTVWCHCVEEPDEAYEMMTEGL